VELRHLHIEQQRVRLGFSDCLHGFEPVLAIGHHRHVGHGGQQLCPRQARGSFIVPHHYAEDLAVGHGCGTSVRAGGTSSVGTVTDTRYVPSWASAANAALSPNVAANRRRTMSMPNPVPFRRTSGSYG